MNASVIRALVGVALVAVFVGGLLWPVRADRSSAPSPAARCAPRRSTAAHRPEFAARQPTGSAGAPGPVGSAPAGSAPGVVSVDTGMSAVRRESPRDATSLAREVLARYRDEGCWVPVVAQHLDLTGSSWGAVFRSADDARVALVLALPSVLGRPVSAQHPLHVSEVVVDVGHQARALDSR